MPLTNIFSSTISFYNKITKHDKGKTALSITPDFK